MKNSLKGKNVKCGNCDKEIYCRQSFLKKVNFCSKKCFWEFCKKGEMFKSKNTGSKIICSECGKEKYYTKYKIDNLNPKYCSNECKFKVFIRNNPKKYSYIPCIVCGKLFYYPPSQQKKGKKFCSMKCKGTTSIKNLGTRMLNKKHSEQTKIKMSLAQLGKPRLNQRGDKSNNWKGGTKDLNTQIRKSFEYRNWRRTCFEKGKYLCFWGGKEHGNKLNVDHIKPFALILKENNIKTFEEALNCKELWNIENGRVLCEKCHKKTDTYGWRGYYKIYNLLIT